MLIMMVAKLPQIINPEYDKSSGGGTNPIFGVDGSPVIHDAFIRGYNFRGEYGSFYGTNDLDSRGKTMCRWI